MDVIYGGNKYKVLDVAESCGCVMFGIQDEPDDNPEHCDWVSNCEICESPIKAKDARPKHLQKCICWDKFMKEWRIYMYDNIDKYWCTCGYLEHDEDGDNHVSDYADYRITKYYPI